MQAPRSTHLRTCMSFKIFHIVRDATSSQGAEKVFLVEEALRDLKRNLQGSMEIIGLMGPGQMINLFLDSHQISSVEDNPKEESQDIDIQPPGQISTNLALEKDEMAALFVIKQLNQVADKYQTIYLCFVTDDDFYYQKPINENSINYMLIRFMGDLCTRINILYDQKMEADFEEKGGPYSSSQKKIYKIKMTKRTEKDIKSKEIPCDLSSLYKFDPEYPKKVMIGTPVHSKYVVCMRQTLKEDYRRQLMKKLYRDQQRLWELIFKKSSNGLENIIQQIEQPISTENIEIVKELISIHTSMKKIMLEFGVKCFEKCIKYYTNSFFTFKWIYSKDFQHNIYQYTIGNYVAINPEKKQWYFKNNNEFQVICHNISMDIYCQQKKCSTILDTHQVFKRYVSNFIWDIWIQCRKIIQEHISRSLFLFLSFSN